MKQYIIITVEGYTESPNGDQVDNCQMLGYACGESNKDAINNLFAQNTSLVNSGYIPEHCVAYELANNAPNQTAKANPSILESYDALEANEKRALISAIQSHGGEYVFIHLNEYSEADDADEIENAPIVWGTSQWNENVSSYVVSRVIVERKQNQDCLVIFGWQIDPGYTDENIITDIVYSHLSHIIEAIPRS